jgi:hypothetical protein
MSTADLLVDLDVAVRRDGSVTRLRARHALHGGTVHVCASDGGDVRVRILDVRDWRSELAEVCRVPARRSAPSPSLSDVELPWELVVGTGAALGVRRQDLYAELLARADAGVREQVAQLHVATAGRLRAVGTAPGRRRVGWVVWVLLEDGWRALTPGAAHGSVGRRALVRLEHREPGDLAHDVARWLAVAAR